MLTITADAAMLAKLRAANGLAEIRDDEGTVVGFYAPASVEKAPQRAEAAARVDWEELRRRANSPERGRTLKEVFQHLQSITKDEPMRAYLQQKIDRMTEEEGCPTP